MKLEPKHILPYSPYELKFLYSENTTIEIFTLNPFGAQRLNECSLNHALKDEFKIKPILRNLSDLTKEIEVNGEKFVPILHLIPESFGHIENIEIGDFLDRNVVCVVNSDTKEEFHIYTDNGISVSTRNHNFNISDYKVMQQLFEWKFDVFGLIPAGLAIDINTLNK